MAEDKAKLIADLRQRVAKLPPLQDEPDFFTSQDTLARFLKSRDWKLEEAELMLTTSVEYRRRTRPQSLDCSWCHNRPGYHSMRQVGHDEAGRPVLYSNFAQASTHKNTADDSVTHVTYLIENAKRTMKPGVSTWVFVIDCTGMTLSSCNPKLGYGVTNVLSSHYPERLGLVICVNHSPVFHGVWKAIKQFLHPHTAAKVKMVRSKAKMTDVFSQLFDPELSAWLLEEIALNKQKPLPKTQVEFWSPLPEGSKVHDPRGCPSYVSQYITANCSGPLSGDDIPFATPKSNVRTHRPHPNIVDHQSGHKLTAVTLTKEEELERQQAQRLVESDAKQTDVPTEEEYEETELAYDLDIPGDLQIPATAMPLSASS